MAYETLLIRSDRTFETPPATAPRWADLEAGLYAQWHYGDVASQANESEIVSWTSRVNGFTLTPISGLGKPKVARTANGGRGAVAFNYNDTTETPWGLQVAQGGGFTLDASATGVTLAAVVFNRSLAYGSSPTSRIMSANSSTAYYQLGNDTTTPGVGVRTANGIGATYAPADGSMEDRWYVAVATITPSETRLYVDDLPVITGVGSAATTSSGFRIGVNSAGLNPFTGYTREYRVYRKALSAEEARALIATLRYEHLRLSS